MSSKLPVIGFGVSCLAVVLSVSAVLHTSHWHVSADVLSAIGSFTAAGVALWVATRAERERRLERERAAVAQARLVQITASPAAEDRLKINVDNFGREPILDVEFIEARIFTDSGHRFTTGIRALNRLPIMPPRDKPVDNLLREGTWAPDDFRTVDGDLWRRDDAIIYVEVRVKFTDADGQRWLVSIHADPVREIPIPSPPGVLRGWWRLKRVKYPTNGELMHRILWGVDPSRTTVP
ncbi:hypothetical protein FZI85_06180 [Mycobacterium sp. CBMA293]|uniref:hypothetical protein n=1 Tax=unclassified Mycolicibacterium TaxID=2636767 RepID=UPI0012DCDD7C|nr:MULTISPECIES: hypothetical protein [unclassified Mycolicibacterium]MUL45159.1 hypothetical protein [Mycolicibacterium sp. CBMA 360]MUL56677.1 hypothetical protein [Mycolicibacterium sp. CBMA 335]MUL69716.1 hypothetical protein [Mycolicibacterium sp. CBMA 311]MUL91764.1 hypothetical protein [Mycolicibacterium sp. CBMA 230]MUM10620.1 hypothetical protein [Mycolicibacterium sp. CBMA 293]